MRQHTSAYASTRQHPSAYGSIRQHTSDFADGRVDRRVNVARKVHVLHYETRTEIVGPQRFDAADMAKLVRGGSLLQRLVSDDARFRAVDEEVLCQVDRRDFCIVRSALVSEAPRVLAVCVPDDPVQVHLPALVAEAAYTRR